MLEKTLVSPLDSKEIKPVNPKGNQLGIRDAAGYLALGDLAQQNTDLFCDSWGYGLKISWCEYNRCIQGQVMYMISRIN